MTSASSIATLVWASIASRDSLSSATSPLGPHRFKPAVSTIVNSRPLQSATP